MSAPRRPATIVRSLTIEPFFDANSQAAPMTGFSHTAVELYDAGFGPFMVPVEPRTKTPAEFVEGRWRKVSSVTAFCASHEEAIKWDAAGASVGLRGGDAFLWIDNDFGRLFTRLIEQMFHDLGVVSLRRFVDSATHRRDAFLLRVSGKTKTLTLAFRDTVLGVEGKFGLRGSGQQAVITGIHPDTGKLYLTSHKLRRIEDVPEVPASVFSDAFQGLVDQALKAGLEATAGMPSSGSLVHAVPRALDLAGPTQTRAQTGSNPSLAHDLLDPVEIAQLLGFLPNDPTKWSKALGDFLSVYDNWVKVCFAIIGATGGSSAGRALWIEWSDQQAQTISSSDQWDHCIHSAQTGGVRVGGTFLIELAQKFAWEAYHKASAQTFADHPVHLPDDPRPLWEAFRTQWAIWSRKSRYINLATGGVHDTRGFNMACNRELPRLWVERHGSAKKPANISTFVDRQNDLLHVEGITYHPGQPRLFRDAAGFSVFNEWTAPVFARFPVSATDVKPWLDHLHYVLKTPQEVELFIHWCAFLGQHPDDKPNWGWQVMGLPGVGKDTMIDKPMRVLLGHENVQPFDFAQLERPHNYFVRCKLLIASEIAQHDDLRKARGNFDRFKRYTARPPEFLEVNPKGLPPYLIPNRCGAVLFSNEFNPVAFDYGDRRLHVLSCLDIKPQSKAYYAGLYDWLDNQNGALLVANYLDQFTLTQADIQELKGPAPMTAVKGTLTSLNSNRVVDHLWHLIVDARNGGRFASLVVTAEALTRPLSTATSYEVTPRQVNAGLYELAARGEVFPARPSPSEPDRPGKVSSKTGDDARFWLLADVHPQTGVKLRELTGQALFDAFDVSQASQFPPNVVPIRPKKPSKKGFSTTVPDDPV
jgi:Family of unknown function (DUF5906)